MTTNALKALSKTDDELRVGNYIVLFGGRDLEFVQSGPNPDKSLGTRFAPDVEIESEYTQAGRLPIGFEHGKDPVVGGKALGWVDWSTATRDEKGVFVERVLNRREKYVQFVEELIEAGLIGTSSEAIPDNIKALADGTIISWPLKGDTLTVSPVEPRMMAEFGENHLRAFKALAEEVPAAKALLSLLPNGDNTDSSKGSAREGGSADAGNAPANQPTPKKSFTKEKAMNLMDVIKQLVPGLADEQYQQLAAVLSLAGHVTPEAASEKTVEGGDQPTDESMRALDLQKLTSDIKALGYTIGAPGAAVRPGPAVVRPVFETRPAPAASEPAANKSFEAAYFLRYGEESEAHKAIMTDYIGKDYRQLIHEQNVAYGRYLRGGDRALDAAGIKALSTLYFPTDAVIAAVKEGSSVGAIKATQVEAVGELGGFAVPPNVQSEISRRAVGLSAVRGSGARVVQLVNSNGIEIPLWRGNSSQYMGVLRGAWGNETKAPGEKNFKMDLELVMAHIYTYKVPMSQSLLEDAANVVTLVNEDIATTKTMDEDIAFLIGSGAGRPRGILPNSTNTDALTEVLSGAASTLTATGINGLKRGVPSQYRDKAKTVFVGNSDTFGAIEGLTVGGGNLNWAFPELIERDEIRGFKTFEQESLPDVAGAAYPLLFCNMGGYTIVERLGMTIQRFQDSNTGPNKVEFHVRARIGGRIEKPWMFAVQKVGTS
jgi:HK97 family phage major capsid protein